MNANAGKRPWDQLAWDQVDENLHGIENTFLPVKKQRSKPSPLLRNVSNESWNYQSMQSDQRSGPKRVDSGASFASESQAPHYQRSPPSSPSFRMPESFCEGPQRMDYSNLHQHGIAKQSPQAPPRQRIPQQADSGAFGRPVFGQMTSLQSPYFEYGAMRPSETSPMAQPMRASAAMMANAGPVNQSPGSRTSTSNILSGKKLLRTVGQSEHSVQQATHSSAEPNRMAFAYSMPHSLQTHTQQTTRGSTSIPAGTQANPINLDEPSEMAAPATNLASSSPAPKPVESGFYAVARGLLPGVYPKSEKRDAGMCMAGWPDAKYKRFTIRTEAMDYVRQHQLDDATQFAKVQNFFGAFTYNTQKEFLKMKETYRWFKSHRKARTTAWALKVKGPIETPYIKEIEEGGKVAGSGTHDPNSRQEHYGLAPAMPILKPRPEPKRLISPKRYSNPVDDMLFGKDHVDPTHSSPTSPPVTSRTREPRQAQSSLQAAQHQYEQAMIENGKRMLADGEQYYRDPINAHLGIVTAPVAGVAPPVEVRVEPQLCDEQQRLVDLILAGHNVFYTGSAGCGKSTVLKAFVKELKERGQDVRIVAPTGKAALEVGGTTYFTFAGWVPSHFKKSLKDLRKGAHQKWVQKRMRSVSVLIIDEVSMLENHIFERLNEVMKEARSSNHAFGGCQIVVTGDFCQLPPVKPFKHCLECGREMQYRAWTHTYKCNAHGEFAETDKWAFASRAWKECSFRHVNLTQIHRQRDRAFINILERCRLGKILTQTETDLLLNHPCNVENPTRLYSTRLEVSRFNDAEYAKLKGKARTFKGFDHAEIKPHHPNLVQKGEADKDGFIPALREGKFEPTVDLKEGMRVVLQVNMSIDEGLVNGAQGVVVGWEEYDKEKLPKAEKQSATITKPGKSARSGRGGSMEPEASFSANTIHGDHAAYRESRLKDFCKYKRVKEWPIVEFDNGQKRTIYAECLVYEFGDDPPYSIMSRTQVPLIPGWAMTVHKSQGMTLNQVEVDLGKAFEEGQVYVALSRAISLEGLRVKSLGQRQGGGNAEVHEFLREKFGIAI